MKIPESLSLPACIPLHFTDISVKKCSTNLSMPGCQINDTHQENYRRKLEERRGKGRGPGNSRPPDRGSCQRFSLWICFRGSRTHVPCSVSLSSPGMLSSKIRILRNGSQSQNPFVPQVVAWIGDRIAPVGKYC